MIIAITIAIIAIIVIRIVLLCPTLLGLDGGVFARCGRYRQPCDARDVVLSLLRPSGG